MLDCLGVRAYLGVEFCLSSFELLFNLGPEGSIRVKKAEAPSPTSKS